MASIVKRGHQTGARFQEIINFVNEQYERAGVACITRKAVPGKYVRGKQNPNTSLSVSTRISATDFRKLSQHHFSQKFIPESKAEPDYGGVIAPHGQGIFYDAKSTTRQSLDFDNFRGEDVRPWLFAIVRNAAYRALGDRQRSANVVSLDEVFTRAAEEDGPGRRPEPPTDEPSAEDRLIQSAERELVLSALAELPAAFREVVILRELEGFDYRAIAEITGSVVGTVMSRLARGRVALRKALMRRIEEDKSNVV